MNILCIICHHKRRISHYCRRCFDRLAQLAAKKDGTNG